MISNVDHGGCNTTGADHGEAEVRRHEDVVLKREPGVASYMVYWHRDLYIADSGGDACHGLILTRAISTFSNLRFSHLLLNALAFQL